MLYYICVVMLHKAVVLQIHHYRSGGVYSWAFGTVNPTHAVQVKEHTKAAQEVCVSVSGVQLRPAQEVCVSVPGESSSGSVCFCTRRVQLRKCVSRVCFCTRSVQLRKEVPCGVRCFCVFAFRGQTQSLPNLKTVSLCQFRVKLVYLIYWHDCLCTIKSNNSNSAL